MDSLAQLSIIVPLAPGETTWRELLTDLTALPTGAQIIIVRASGVPLSLPQWAAGADLMQCETSPGRARQMNLGARTARGRWLWFLHADSRLAPDSLDALRTFIESHNAALGWFDLVFLADGPRLARLNAWGARVRSRSFGLPFGDQGLVMPAASFAAIGGYDETAAYGEDHLLVWAAHAARLPVLRVGAVLYTSARTYARNGWLTTTLRHWVLTLRQALPRWWRARRQLRQ
jgi:rSAM/selenodomain-associated transferase 2